MNLKSVLEGLLFIAGDEGLSIDELKYVLSIDKKSCLELVEELMNDLENEERGIRINKIDKVYKFVTKAEHHSYYQKLVSNPSGRKLSTAALETLAIIAYNQPVTKIGIEKIRGVNADSMIRKLQAKALVKEVGREESPGRPVLFAVTHEFMDYFGLTTLEELPELSEFTNEDVEEETDLFMRKFEEDKEDETSEVNSR